MNDSDEVFGPTERRLAELLAARCLVWELEAMIDRTIVLARHEPILSWRDIGDAPTISGWPGAVDHFLALRDRRRPTICEAGLRRPRDSQSLQVAEAACLCSLPRRCSRLAADAW